MDGACKGVAPATPTAVGTKRDPTTTEPDSIVYGVGEKRRFHTPQFPLPTLYSFAGRGSQDLPHPHHRHPIDNASAQNAAICKHPS